MAYEIVMPRLGWTMEEGVFVEWLKRDGDIIKAGDLICSVEGDKAINEIESFENGILRIPPDAPPPGLKIKVGTLLGYILAPGEAAPWETFGGAGQPATASATPATAAAADGATRSQGIAAPAVVQESAAASRHDTPKISPRARRIASELGVSWQALKGSGRTGRIVERDVRAAAVTARPAMAPAATPAAAELRISPLARRRAEELGVDVQSLAAAQAGRRIEVVDVEAASKPVKATAGAPAPAAATAPLSSIRRIIADRMHASVQTTASVTLTTEADATELVRLRKSIAADLHGSAAAPPSYNDLLAKLVAVALQEHPALNASLVDDQLVQHAAVHIGLAVDTERGLLVPVVRDVQNRSVQAIAADSARLIEQARSGKIAAGDLRGSTFSISNLGMYEIDAFTPIINLPECAILGVGRIVAKQVVIDEEAETVAIRKLMTLSLSFDHRLVDGAPAARFLQRVKQFIERPYAWLTR